LRQFVSFATRTGKQQIGRIVSNEFLAHRVPVELVPDDPADVHQMAKRGGAVAGLDVGVRLLPAAKTIEEILDVSD
jgi:hypothetical protein